MSTKMSCFILLCLFGCSSAINVHSDAQGHTAEPDEASQMTNIHFKATGNEPFWSLEINFDKNMHFKSLNHPKEIITPVPEPDIAQDVPVKRYWAITESGELIVSIIPVSCTDNMSGAEFTYKVSVQAKTSSETDYTDFEGCGGYLVDTRLHNIWVVEEMGGQKIESADFNNGVPTMELYPEEGRVSGHDGCNRFFGKIENQQGELKFSAMGSTRMACPDMEKSDQFLKLISDQSFAYNFEANQLVLKQGDQVVMRLKNVD